MAVACAGVIGAALLGCGGSVESSSKHDRASGSVSAAARGISEACSGLGRTTVRVLCPAWLPGGPADRWSGGPLSGGGRCSYLISAVGSVSSDQVPFHVMFGGRCRRFSLAETARKQWPIRPDFNHYLGLIGENPPHAGKLPPAVPVRLRVIERTAIGQTPAVVLQVAAYPDAGVQKGHYAIVWNRGDAGYELSYHYTPRGDNGQPPTQAEIQALRRGAAAMISGAGSR